MTPRRAIYAALMCREPPLLLAMLLAAPCSSAHASRGDYAGAPPPDIAMMPMLRFDAPAPAQAVLRVATARLPRAASTISAFKTPVRPTFFRPSQRSIFRQPRRRRHTDVPRHAAAAVR
jgi:hypothetical protein